MGILLGRWDDSGNGAYQSWRVYRTRGGKYAVFHERAPEFRAVNAEGKPAGWRGHLGIGEISYGSAPRTATLDVFATIDDLQEVVPAGLWEMVARSANEPDVEDLDL
jgi:EXLDI family protein